MHDNQKIIKYYLYTLLFFVMCNSTETPAQNISYAHTLGLPFLDKVDRIITNYIDTTSSFAYMLIISFVLNGVLQHTILKLQEKHYEKLYIKNIDNDIKNAIILHKHCLKKGISDPLSENILSFLLPKNIIDHQKLVNNAKNHYQQEENNLKIAQNNKNYPIEKIQKLEIIFAEKRIALVNALKRLETGKFPPLSENMFDPLRTIDDMVNEIKTTLKYKYNNSWYLLQKNKNSKKTRLFISYIILYATYMGFVSSMLIYFKKIIYYSKYLTTRTVDIFKNGLKKGIWTSEKMDEFKKNFKDYLQWVIISTLLFDNAITLRSFINFHFISLCLLIISGLEIFNFILKISSLVFMVQELTTDLPWFLIPWYILYCNPSYAGLIMIKHYIKRWALYIDTDLEQKFNTFTNKIKRLHHLFTKSLSLGNYTT